MTHADLVERAVRWLRGSRRCDVVYAELATVASCIPDAIGWTARGSELVEAKVSRSDFLRDRDKPAHRAGFLPGNRRWYLTPGGLLQPADVPPGWGLVEIRGERVFKVVEAPAHPDLGVGGWQTERTLLRSAARRHELGVPFDPDTGRFEAAR